MVIWLEAFNAKLQCYKCTEIQSCYAIHNIHLDQSSSLVDIQQHDHIATVPCKLRKIICPSSLRASRSLLASS